MKTIRLTTSILLAAIALTGCQTTKPAPAAHAAPAAPVKAATPTGDLLVPNLKTASLDQTHKTWLLEAAGTVPTSGWSKKGKLVAVYNRFEMLQGIYRYQFVATPPAKGVKVAQVVTPIKATLPVSDPKSQVKIFRIQGGDGIKDIKVKK